jgi:hypothetical protein
MSTSRRPETRSTTRQTFIDRRKKSIQHRYVHTLIDFPSPQQLAPFPDTSCPICDPPSEIIKGKGYQRRIGKLTEFDPELQISGKNQRDYFALRQKEDKQPEEFRALIESFTFINIPADFKILAKSLLLKHSDTWIGQIDELSNEQIDKYHSEVEDYLHQQNELQAQQIIPQTHVSNFPATPAQQSHTPLKQAIEENSRLQNIANRIFGWGNTISEDEEQPTDKRKGKAPEKQSLPVRTRDSIEPSDDNSPLYLPEGSNAQEQVVAAPVSPADTEESNSEIEEIPKVGNNTEIDAQYLVQDVVETESNISDNEEEREEIVESEPEVSDIESEPEHNPLPIVLPQVQPIVLPQIQQIPMARNADYPVFDGTKPGAWIKTMQIAFAANAVANDAIKVNIAAAHLGEYVDWYTGQAAFTHWTGGVDPANRNFKDLFLQHFAGPEEKDNALAQMWKRKQRRNETITSYANGLERIWNATEVVIPDAIKLSQFIGGLDPNIQNLVRAQNPANIAEAIASSKRVSGGGSHGAYLTHEEENPLIAGLITQLAELNKEIANMKAAGINQEREERPIQQKRNNRAYENVQCENCGKNGHRTENCWSGNTGRRRERMQCYHCKGYGHIQKDCWAKRKRDTPSSGKGRGRP